MAQTWTSLGLRSKRLSCSGTEAFAQPVKATVTVAFSSAVAGNTVTVHGMTYTATANGGDATGTNFPVGAGGSANTDTGTAFVAAIARNFGSCGITAVNASGTVTLTAPDFGTLYNAWAVTKVGTPITLGGAVFSGGVDFTGILLEDVGAVIATAYAISGQTLTGGSYVWYWTNPVTGIGGPVHAMDDASTSAERSKVFVGPFTGLGAPIIFSDGYLALLPSGVTVSSGALTIDLMAYQAGPGQFSKTL